jgi:curved DNA-binding protein CbpA
MNFYAVLGIPRDADEEAIRNAYRILARRYHPDRGVGSSAEKFREVNEAYETLIDNGSRHVYHLSLHLSEPPVRVRVEPMQSGPFWQEDAGVFGRFGPAPQSIASLNGLSVLVKQWFDSFDDLFFGSTWPC